MAQAALDIAPEQFSRAERRSDAQALSRPSLSYWQDAWRRLRRNARAMASLIIIAALAVFTLFGPLLWQVDPAQQNLEQISQPPNLGMQAIVVARGSRWPGIRLDDWPEAPDPGFAATPHAPLPAPQNLRVVGQPSTWSVKLTWEPVRNAAGYSIYRNTYRPTALNELGLPLGETLTGNAVSWEDQLSLEPRTYFYSVLASDGVEESSRFTTVEVTAAPSVLLDNAISRGLLDADTEIVDGMSVRLDAHPLGTDYLGRDMLARLIDGARTSLFIGICAPLLFVFFGTLYGAFAGFLGGRSDAVLMRFADFVVALPFLLFMILFRIAAGIEAGESGVIPMLLAMVILLWPATARLVRGQILQIREQGYVQAARLLGASDRYLILRHMVPNTMGVILVTLTFAIPSAIFIEAFLSFIGMGVAPPTASWGSMCNDGLKTMLQHPHELILPALFISATVLAFNLLGDGLRDALDARMRSGE